MELFINGIGILSPQQSLAEADFTLEKLVDTPSNRLSCIEPTYSAYINPSALRRMSRIIKMGITSSKICLENAKVEMPDAIITATGLGCLDDTEKFVRSIDENNEQLLTPTPFIQSTHNTVGGQIALLLGCHSYNTTYVHRGNSFEAALIDANLLIQEKEANTILIGAIDELTNTSHAILQQLEIYSSGEDLSKIAGEGSTFFLVSNEKKSTSKSKITSVVMLIGNQTLATITAAIKKALAQSTFNLILLGNSNEADDNLVTVKNTLFSGIPSISFKKYCGEYTTSTAFAVAMASKLIENNPKQYSSILILNHFNGEEYSFLVVEKC